MSFAFTRTFSLASFLCALLVLSGCTLSRLTKKAGKEQVITAQPQVLMVRGDRVPVEVRAQLPKNLLRNDYRYGIRVFYKADKGVEEHVGSLGFDFGNYSFEEGKPTMLSSFSFPYGPSKNRGQLMAQGIMTGPKNRKKYTKPVELAPGILTTPHMVQTLFAPTYAPEVYNNEAPGPLTFPIYFDQGLATLRHGYGTNLRLLEEFIDSNQKTKMIEILAMHSPDDMETSTRNLAARRATAVERFIKQKMESESYNNHVKEIDFDTRVLSKNWDAFLGRVQNSALPEEQIQQILEIVNGSGTFSQKEEKLQALPAYEYLEMYVYPVLRHAQVKVDYQPNLRRDYEVYLLAKKVVENRANADVLTAEEMQYAATLTPLLAEKRRIYESAVETYMNWQSLNNLGMVFYEQAQKELRPKVKQSLLQNAILNLRYAAHRQPNAQQFYNLAVAHHQQGEPLEALQSYDYAVRLGGPLPILQQVFSDKAALELSIGQYDDAVRSLTYAGTGYAAQFNMALVYFLKENYEGSAALFQKLLQQHPGDANTHYMLAVIGARSKNEELLAENLKLAIKAKPALAGKAIDDLEFREYHKAPVFARALKP